MKTEEEEEFILKDSYEDEEEEVEDVKYEPPIHSNGVEINRAGIVNGSGTFLAITLGEPYISYLRFWILKEPSIAFYTFAFIFEKTLICGESGLHRFIESINIGKPSLYDDRKSYIFPCAAKLTITLDEYERIRKRVSGTKRDVYGQRAEFPPYIRVESRANKSRS